ncbi:hypothetical protein ACFYY8_12250 [Streptosporangium sp. NPDC001559]|uniref:hypothetical protein n=1 Tax=Streptosporangium sp. NPDC001559 TaxID=3366187 RepID=UPI0036F15982
MGCLAATVVAAWAGAHTLVIPSASSQGWTEMASSVATPLPFAFLIGGGLHSAMASLEQTAGSRLIRAEIEHIAGAILFAGLLLGSATSVTGSAVGAVEAVRNLLLYAGLALVSGRVFGRALSWILPLADFVVLDFWGMVGPHPAWWAWQYQAYDHAVAWIASVGSLTIGVAAFCVRGVRSGLWPSPGIMGVRAKAESNRAEIQGSASRHG